MATSYIDYKGQVRRLLRITNKTTGEQSVIDQGSWYSNRTEFTVTKTERREKPLPFRLGQMGTSRYWFTNLAVDPGVNVRTESETQISIYTHPILELVPPLLTVELPDFGDVDGRLRAKIKAQTGNILQDLAEYKQTSNLFVSVTRDVIKHFRTLRRGRGLSEFLWYLKTPQYNSKSKDAANQWLRFQYGMRPLMNSIYDYTDALSNRVRVGIRYSARTSLRSTADGGYHNSYGYQICEVTRTRRAKASWIVRDGTLKTLSQVGITNPASLVWELIPYSFVLDWFCNVGDFLESIDALVGVEDLVVNDTFRTSTWYKSVVDGDKKAYYETIQMGRERPRTMLALPRLALRSPLGKDNWRSRIASSLALLRQFRR